MRRKRLRSFLPVLIAGASLVLTLTGWYLSQRSLDLYNQARFQNYSSKIRSDISFRLQTYINTLLQTRNMIAVSPYVSRKAFKNYVEGLDFGTHYPGIQGIGYVETIKSYDLKSHVSQVRSEGIHRYDVWPKGNRKFYYAVTYLEPQNSLNDAFMGFDMATDETLMEAMTRANRANAPAASGMIELGHPGPKSSGFVILVPIYKNNSNIKTEESRQSNLVGFLFSIFKASDLFEGIFKKPNLDDQIGYSVKLVGKNPRTLYDHSPNRPPGMFEKIYNFEVAGESWELTTYSLPHFNAKSYQWIPWLVFTLGSLITFILFVSLRNYTKQALLEIQRAAENASLYRQAQEAIKVRDEFMGIASHELKTPITSLRLQMDLIARILSKPDSVEGKERTVQLTQSAQKQISRLISLIENLLDASRITAGKLVLNLEEVNISELTLDILDRLQPQFTESGSVLTTKIGDSIVGHFDRLRLEQVIINLLTNAIKYGNGKPILLEITQNENHVEISVEDNGVGIATEDLSKVFERYERIKNSTKASGLGLGLFILKQIVEAHGGNIQLRSTVDKGSTFKIMIPRK